jgi:hypothetical protein
VNLYDAVRQEIGTDNPGLRSLAATVTMALVGHRPAESPLLIGPTGCGKTTLALALAKILKSQVRIIDATSLSVPGYQGGHLDEIISKPPKILILDEIDKCARSRGDGKLDPGGVTLQHSLLSVLDGTSSVTGQALVIGMGAFAGLDRHVFQRLGEVPPTDPLQVSTDTETRLLRAATVQDLVRFGFEPEFARRWRIVPMSVSPHVGERMLERDIRAYENYFQHVGGALEVTARARDHLGRLSCGRSELAAWLEPSILEGEPIWLVLDADSVGLCVRELEARSSSKLVHSSAKEQALDTKNPRLLVAYTVADTAARAWWRGFELTSNADACLALAQKLHWHGINLDRFFEAVMRTAGDISGALSLLLKTSPDA